ncbi:MAG TPA: ABC transporter permease [Sporichthyaceae bacterium]|jgi:putative ABC transport system permease protein
MRFAESIRFALHGIVANKMRSLLTMLGILIGVASVITLVAVGTGSSRDVQTSISRLGSNTLFVLPLQEGGGGSGRGIAAQVRRLLGIKAPPVNGTQVRSAELTFEDAESLKDPINAPHVKNVAPGVLMQRVEATHGTSSHTVNLLIGTKPVFLGIDNSTITCGPGFTDEDYDAHKHLALLGTSVAQDLASGDVCALNGEQIRINGQAFIVAGILNSKGYSGQQDLDDRILAPGTAVQDALYGYNPPGAGPISGIAVEATSGADTKAAQSEVTAIMMARHHVNLLSADFIVFNSSAVLDVSGSANHTLTILLAAVAGISLLVGGIGVMNIMLVSVTERTREIGIRKAIGAGRMDIIGQFLGEAVILSMVGGVLGVLCGFAAAHFKIAGVEPVVAPYSVYLALAVSLFTGLFFGLYPASRAADLRPIDALRYE